MQDKVKSILGRLGALLLAEIFKPIEEIKAAQNELSARINRLDDRMNRFEARIEKLHEIDPVITECDLASLDNQICTRIAKCRERGYTTSEDRRIVSRMHDVYRRRGGNHGEENEYAIFCKLMTKEEHDRMKGEAV